MPIHDWRRVIAGTFHHFHQMWIGEICEALNGGLLPNGFYAMADQVAGGPHPDVLTLESVTADISDEIQPFSFDKNVTATAVAEHPPLLRYKIEAEEAIYAAEADRIAVYDVSGDRVVAFLEIISPGNKRSETSIKQLIGKLLNAMANGCHLLIIDLFSPGRHDPQGLHAELWSKADPPLLDGEPLAIPAYRAAPSTVAYIEPTAVGRLLVDAPLFLTEEFYVNVPLEQTYMAAWKRVPDRWKQVIDPARNHHADT